MDQELMTIIQNIEALIQQAKQTAGGELIEKEDEKFEEVTPDMLEKIMRAIDGEEEEKDEVEKVKKEEEKEEVEKSDLGETASDDAEVRANEGTPSEDEIAEVAKTIAKMLIAKKSVKKSNDKTETYKIMKSLASEVMELKKAMSSMIEGMGIAEQIIQPVQKSKPMNNLSEIQKSLDVIKGIAEKKTVDINDGTGTGSHYVSKALAEGDGTLLRGLFHRNAK